jgi:hypothetical protein
MLRPVPAAPLQPMRCKTQHIRCVLGQVYDAVGSLSGCCGFPHSALGIIKKAVNIRVRIGLMNSIGRRCRQKCWVGNGDCCSVVAHVLTAPIGHPAWPVVGILKVFCLGSFARIAFRGNLGGFYPMSGGSGQCSRFSYGDDLSVLLNPFFCERILENSIVCGSRQCCFRFCTAFLGLDLTGR